MQIISNFKQAYFAGYKRGIEDAKKIIAQRLKDEWDEWVIECNHPISQGEWISSIVNKLENFNWEVVK